MDGWSLGQQTGWLVNEQAVQSLIARFVGWLNPLLSHAVVFCSYFLLL